MSNISRKLIVGVDLDSLQPQICCYEPESDKTVTAPMKIGNDNVSLEDMMSELEESGEEPDGGDRQKKDGLMHEIADLFRRALVTLGISDPAEQITGMTITVPNITRMLVWLVHGIYESFGIGPDRGFIQDYRESFYYHTMYQKKELWTRNVGFFAFSGRNVSFMSLSVNNLTRPMTVTSADGVTITLKGERDTWDEQFYNMIDLSLRQNIYSSIFIQGDTFDREWAPKSVGLLCKGGRKVFITDNVFARGACFAAREKTVGRRLTGYLYMGDDLVRINIGMNMLVQGKETYYPMVSAGVNWYETDKTCECILTEGNTLDFLVSGIDDGKQRISKMELTGLEDAARPYGTTRIKLHIYFDAPGRCIIEAEDLGFGDIFPTTGTMWRKVLED